MALSLRKGQMQDEETQTNPMDTNSATFTYTVLRSLNKPDINFEWFDSLFKKNNFHIYAKKEIYQNMNSLKARGVAYTMMNLTNKQKRKGVIAISTGSFGFVLCYYGRKFDIPVTVVMPKVTKKNNIELMKNNIYKNTKGGLIRVVTEGNTMTEAHYVALNIAIEEGLFYLDGNEHPNMIIGQATMALEIVQERNVAAVLLPTTVGNSGLIAATAMVIKSLKPKIQIIEVKSQDLDPLFQNVRKRTDRTDELNISIKEYKACAIDDLPDYVINESILITKNSIKSATEYLDEYWINETEEVPVDRKLRYSQNFTCPHKSINHSYLKYLKFADHYDPHKTIAIAAILSGQLNKLQRKKIIILSYGKMDSIEDLLSNEEPNVDESNVDSSYTRDSTSSFAYQADDDS